MIRFCLISSGTYNLIDTSHLKVLYIIYIVISEGKKVGRKEGSAMNMSKHVETCLDNQEDLQWQCLVLNN